MQFPRSSKQCRQKDTHPSSFATFFCFDFQTHNRHGSNDMKRTPRLSLFLSPLGAILAWDFSRRLVSLSLFVSSFNCIAKAILPCWLFYSKPTCFHSQPTLNLIPLQKHHPLWGPQEKNGEFLRWSRMRFSFVKTTTTAHNGKTDVMRVILVSVNPDFVENILNDYSTSREQRAETHFLISFFLSFLLFASPSVGLFASNMWSALPFSCL